MRSLIIGIAGASGSGKSTFSDILSEGLSEYKIKVIRSDNYFKPNLPKMISPVSQKEYDDFNHPESIDYRKLIADLTALIEGENEIELIILEGILILYYEEIRKLLDLKIFIDLDSEERMYRRIKRNMAMRGLSMEEIASYYLESVKYREKEYILPTKVFADIILNGNILNDVTAEVIMSWIKDKIEG